MEEEKIENIVEVKKAWVRLVNRPLPLLIKDMWFYIALKFLESEDINNARLAAKYFYHGLTPVWDDIHSGLYKSCSTAFGQSLFLNKGLLAFAPTDFKSPQFPMKLSSVSISKTHSLFLSKDRKLFGLGENKLGELGIPEADLLQQNNNNNNDNETKLAHYQLHELKQLPVDQKTDDIDTGYSHSLILVENKYGYVAKGSGSNSYGQLGFAFNEKLANETEEAHHQKNTLKEFTDLDLPNGYRAKFTACGSYHTLILTDQGKVLSSGKNDAGQCGLGHQKHQYGFQLVEFDEDIIAIAASSEHSLFLGESCTVYGCGKTRFDRLGKQKARHLLKPTPLLREKDLASLKNPEFEKIFAGNMNSFLIDKNGSVYAAGLNTFGQLGIGHGENVHTFTKIQKLPAMKTISASQNHTVGISQDGELFGCGKNGDLELNPEYRQSIYYNFTSLDPNRSGYKYYIDKRKPITKPIVNTKQFLSALVDCVQQSLENYAEIAGQFDGWFIRRVNKAPTKAATLVLKSQLDHPNFDEHLATCDLLTEIIGDDIFNYEAQKSPQANLLKAVEQHQPLKNILIELCGDESISKALPKLRTYLTYLDKSADDADQAIFLGTVEDKKIIGKQY